jgi:hypothetical protein
MIECKICNKNFKIITNTHLRDKHDMSMEEYKSKFNLSRVSPEGWMRGEHNSFYGRSHKEGISEVKSKEYRDAASKRRKGKPPEEFLVSMTPEEYGKKLSKALSGKNNGMYGKTHSSCYKARLSKKFKGSDNPNWRGGFCRLPYSSDFDEKKKHKIREREGFKCFLCESPELTRKLDVHHINYDKMDSDDLNLVALCAKCHAPTRATKNQDLWETYLTIEIHKRYGNQQVSQSNGDNCRLETSETTW